MARPSLQSPTLQSRALLAAVLIVTVLFAIILWPLSGAISWAVFIAIVFSSLQERSVEVCGGRRGWAAFGTLLVIIVSVILPTVLLAVAVTNEATAFYGRVKSGDVQVGNLFETVLNVMPGWVREGLQRIGVEDLPALQQKGLAALARSSEAITARAFSIGQNALEFFINFFVMIYLLFFLLRDGRALAEQTAQALPLETGHTRRLLDQFAVVVRATVKGNVVIALVQGALGGLAFWFLGISGALLWASAMAVLSLLPAVGAALVWGPVALYLLSTGSVWQGVALIVWGTVVIGLVDNFLRPVLVGKTTSLPDYLVLVATLGGLSVFGPNGFVLGPVIAALFLVSWDIFSQARREPPVIPEKSATQDASRSP